MGLYRLYRGVGSTADCIDWDVPVAEFASGEPSAGTYDGSKKLRVFVHN
jgi:hypothetical protein